jgi:hypothetical protein
MTSDYPVGDLGVSFSSIRPGAADAIGRPGQFPPYHPSNRRPTI